MFEYLEKQQQTLIKILLSGFMYSVVRDPKTKKVNDVESINSLCRIELAKTFLSKNKNFSSALESDIAHYLDLRIPYLYYKLINNINDDCKENYQGISSSPEMTYQFPESHKVEDKENPNGKRPKNIDKCPATPAQMRYLSSLVKNGGYKLIAEQLTVRQADVLIKFFVDDIQPNEEDFDLLEYDV